MLYFKEEKDNHFNFETTDKIEDDEHVPRRLNEAFFQKLQEFGGDRGKEKSNESHAAAPDQLSRSKSVKGRRRSSEVDSDDVRRITNPKRRNSSIQDERSIHDAYHAILNEYNRVGVYSARSDDICHVIHVTEISSKESKYIILFFVI